MKLIVRLWLRLDYSNESFTHYIADISIKMYIFCPVGTMMMMMWMRMRDRIRFNDSYTHCPWKCCVQRWIGWTHEWRLNNDWFRTSVGNLGHALSCIRLRHTTTVGLMYTQSTVCLTQSTNATRSSQKNIRCRFVQMKLIMKIFNCSEWHLCSNVSTNETNFHRRNGFEQSMLGHVLSFLGFPCAVDTTHRSHACSFSSFSSVSNMTCRVKAVLYRVFSIFVANPNGAF